MIAVCLLVLDGLDPVRQQRVSLRYAGEHGLSIRAVAHDPASALALVRDGAAAAVLMAVEVAGGLIEEVLGNVRIFYARRPVVRVSAEEALIRRALKNTSGNVELVAEVLGVPLAQVEASLPARADASRTATVRQRSTG